MLCVYVCVCVCCVGMLVSVCAVCVLCVCRGDVGFICCVHVLARVSSCVVFDFVSYCVVRVKMVRRGARR